RLGFVNNRRGRARLFSEAKRRAQEAGGAKIVMAYEASSCGFVLHEEAEAMGICCWVLAPTKMEKSVEQRQHKNDDRDADDVVEKLRGHVLAGNRLPTVWVPALVNKVVFALMSGLPFKTSFKNGVELVKGFLDAAIDLVPAAVFQ